MDNYKVGRF